MNLGDLIFSVVGSANNPISAVTEGYRGARVNHMGVVLPTARGVFVLEAFPPEVRLTNIAVFRRRSVHADGQPRIMIARLLSEYQILIEPALRYGIDQRNKPYDKLYLTDESALYCSELVVDMFKHANDGVPFFKEKPMSFRDRETGLIHQEWQAYYEYFGASVPEGEPGSNPGDISLDPKLKIYHLEGEIPGLVQ